MSFTMTLYRFLRLGTIVPLLALCACSLKVNYSEELPTLPSLDSATTSGTTPPILSNQSGTDFAVCAGGQLSSGTGIRAIASVGEPLSNTGSIQNGTGVTVISGVKSHFNSP